jgi:methyl-accepting chemotaxis protein
MRLRTLFGLALVLFALVPLVAVGVFSYQKSYDGALKLCERDLEERMDFCLSTCEFYNEAVERGELTKREAVAKVATLLSGPLQDGTRDIKEGLGKGETGYISGMDSEGTWVIHPHREGQNICDLEDKDVELRKDWEKTMNARNRERYEYEWKNPGEKNYYLKVKVLDYFEPFDLHLSISMTVAEFTLSLEAMKKVIMGSIIVAVAVGVVASLVVAQRISKPFTDLSAASSKIIKGDLGTRIDTKSGVEEFRWLREDINRMVEALQEKMEEHRKSLSLLSEVLGKVALGELSARVNLKELKGETRFLGDTLNSIISLLEYDTEEIKREEREFSQAMDIYRDALYKIVQEKDLSLRIDVNRLGGKHKIVGESINQMVDSLQETIKKVEKREEELRQAIGLYSEVLGRVVTGNTTARVDTKLLSGEFQLIGDTFNSIIESLEYYAKKTEEDKSKTKREKKQKPKQKSKGLRV